MKDRIARNPGAYKAMIPANSIEAMQNSDEFEIFLSRNDDPVEDGTPYNKESVLPDDLAEFIGVENENDGDPTPADAFRGLCIQLRQLQYDLNAHATNEHGNNPHELTCDQIGAVAEVELADKVAEIITEDCTEFGPIAEAIDTNTAYTATWVSEMMMSQHDILLYDEDINEHVRNVPTKYEFQSAVGDIEAALDGILAMQTELIGGDGV